MVAENRVVVIAGGSSGIGRALAQAFVRNEDRVVILGRQEARLQAVAAEVGPNCTWLKADIGRREDVEKAVDAIVKTHQVVDVLINNAGYSGYERGVNSSMPLSQAEEAWQEALRVNLTGTFLMIFSLAPHLRHPGGRIINISSDGALTGGPGLRIAGYIAAKAGLLGLTRALALEYGPQGITVNTIAPGFIAGTGMNQQLTPEVVQGIAAQLPVRRAGSPQAVAAAALFLASPEAGFVTGELLNVNGGRVFGR